MDSHALSWRRDFVLCAAARRTLKDGDELRAFAALERAEDLGAPSLTKES